MLDRVNEYVRDIGFCVAEKTGTWEGYTVYTPLFEDSRGRPVPTGLPFLILEKNGRLREVTGLKVFVICDDIFRKAMAPKPRYA